MRHCGRTDFAFFELLLEVVQGDVAPDIAVQVDQDRVGTSNGIEEFCHVVMRFDLNRVRIECQVQTVFHDIACESRPVFVRISDRVGIVVADGTVHLGEQLNFFDGLDGKLETCGYVGHFFTDGCRRSMLAVCAGQHGNAGPFMSKTLELVDDHLKVRTDELTAGRKHQSVRSVVDVFRGAAEMNEFAGGSQMFIDGHLALDPVLNGFNVMVGGFFDVFDRLAVGNGEAAD